MELHGASELASDRAASPRAVPLFLPRPFPGSPSCLKGQLDPSLHVPVEWNQHGFWPFPFPLEFFPAGRDEEREEREEEEPLLEEPPLEDDCLFPPPGLFSLLWENLHSSP